ncbi:E3 ubiquitin-protein ligase TRIM39-like [Trichomycterus rosablanca]|uniref:E3 ubiquitin-protein ligase TRIM39-like n=1 Tax=Trichomycterus rosablanca TaxID=2290929 RepID=UPI002F35B8C9
MLDGSSNLNHEDVNEEVNQQNSVDLHGVQLQLQNTEANTEPIVTLQRSTLVIFTTACIAAILTLLGGVIITGYKLMEMNNQLTEDVTGFQKEFPSLSRKEGIVPEEVWSWIIAEKADVTLNPDSAHAALEVNNNGRSLYTASFSSPPRVPTAETYLICLCVSSKNLLNTRVYFELQVTQSVPWTLGLRTASFNADTTPDSDPDSGIWTIASTNGKIVINDGKAIPTPYTTPTRLGLYLDYEQGQVSFYDAVAKLHLHTYLSSFREKLLFYGAFQVGIQQNQKLLMFFT